MEKLKYFLRPLWFLWKLPELSRKLSLHADNLYALRSKVDRLEETYSPVAESLADIVKLVEQTESQRADQLHVTEISELRTGRLSKKAEDLRVDMSRAVSLKASIMTSPAIGPIEIQYKNSNLREVEQYIAELQDKIDKLPNSQSEQGAISHADQTP